MAEIVQLAEYRQKSRARDGFRLWRRKFKQDFPADTRLNDLNPGVLCLLAEPAEASAVYYYSFILGCLGHGDKALFETLDKSVQLALVDIHLFLTDQVRFEMMRRMGWLARFSATQYRLLDMVLQFDHIRALCHQDPPQLSSAHPDYAEYAALIHLDQQVFIRKLLPSCLDAFRKTYRV